jgi:PAS domain-containing protein
MSFDLQTMNSILEFLISTGTVIGVLFAGWKMIVSPTKKMYNTIQKMSKQFTDILPTVEFIKKEFSVNSGKSIMDRISRIDDNTRLAELRSKLIASNLVTTCMIEFDKSGELIWANKAFLNVTGLDLEQAKNNGWFLSIDENDRERVWNLWKHSLDSKIPFESEFVIKHYSENTARYMKCVVHPHKTIANTSDNILGYYGTIVEIN